MGGLSIALLLAFLCWVAWAMPLYDRGDGPLVGPELLWWAVAFGLLVSLTSWAIHAVARTRKKD
jgi:hypothetical protein